VNHKPQPAPQTRANQRNILLHRETLLLFLIITGSVLFVSTVFFFLWGYFKIGFVALSAFLLIFITRKTDAWKIGVECFYFLTFVLSYAFSPWFALLITISAFVLVIKVRPDELNGSLTQIPAVLGVALTARYYALTYGAAITSSQFFFIGLLSFVIWDFLRFIIANKITPQHWVKLFISFLTGFCVNYLYFKTFGYAILKLLLTL